MKLVYIASVRLPSEKANSLQIMKVCESLATYFDSLELWTGVSRNTKEMNNVKDIYEYYSVSKKFKINYYRQIDSFFLAQVNEWLWSNVRGLSLTINLIVNLFYLKNRTDIVVYTRHILILPFFSFLKKLGIFKFPIYFEAHKFSNRIAYFVRHIDGLVVINNFLKRQYKSFGISHVLTSHDGVSLESFNKISNYQFKKKSHFVLMYFGNLFPWKGVYTLVNCMKFLGPNFKLILIGGSEKAQKDLCDFAVKEGLNKNIEFIDHIPQSELIPRINDSDVLILPNSKKYIENKSTSPIKLFEYMASRRPIIASNIDSLKEVLSENNAFFFKSDNAEDLAKKVIEVCSSDCSEVVNNAYSEAHKFTWAERARNISLFIKK